MACEFNIIRILNIKVMEFKAIMTIIQLIKLLIENWIEK